TMPIGVKKITFFAGCGNVTFENVDFGENGKNAGASFYGDNDRMEVFLGWTNSKLAANRNGDGKLATSVTFRGTDYTPMQNPRLNMGAVGFDGKKFRQKAGVSVRIAPEDLSASFVIEDSTVSYAGARVGVAAAGEASLILTGGKADVLSADGQTYLLGETETYTGNTFVRVFGGEVAHLRGITGAVHDGDLTVGIHEANAAVPTVIRALTVTERTEVTGECRLEMTGGTLQDDFVGGSSTVVTRNTLSGGVVEGTFYGVAEDGAPRVINAVSGGTVNGAFYGGHYGVGYLKNVVNDITDGTFLGSVYGGSRSTTMHGKIKTTLNGGRFEKDVFPGSAGQTNENASITIKRLKPIYFGGTVAPRSETEKVGVIAVRNQRNIEMGPDAQITLNEIHTVLTKTGLSSDDFQSFVPTAPWTPGVVHMTVAIPDVPDDLNTPDVNEALKYSGMVEVFGDSTTIVKKVDENGATWTGTVSRTLTEGYEYPVIPENATYTSSADGMVYDASKASQEKIDALGIANGSMSSAELRQLCVNYFQLQQGFSWTPNETVLNYPTSNVSQYVHEDWMNKTLDQGTIYGSLPYQSLGTGNLYRWMEYYDEETGIFYLSDAMYQNGGFLYGDKDLDVKGQKQYEDVKNPGMKYFFNQCSVAYFWGWARVVNSACFAWTA
ncbi:MAG: hypothetical protein IKR53_05085, partial [Clostridia bacterium]|nr:hypothetical protein [Clostridia bacterium]